jgi:hypothetical protein
MLPIAYRLSPRHIPSEWNVFIFFLIEKNSVCLSAMLCCLSVCLLYTFSFVRDFEKGAYRLSPIISTYTKLVEYAYTYSMSSTVMGTYLLSFVIKGRL